MYHEINMLYSDSLLTSPSFADIEGDGGGGGGNTGQLCNRSHNITIVTASSAAMAASLLIRMKILTEGGCSLTPTATPHSFNGVFSGTTWVSWYQKDKTSLDLNEVRDDGVLGCSGISWTICKQSAPCSRQITTPTPHHSMFTGRMLFLTPSQQYQSTHIVQLYNGLGNAPPKKKIAPSPG